MGLFDELKGQAEGMLGKLQAEHPQLTQEMMGLLHGGQGGLQGLVQKFQQGGMGNLVQSWIGTGANLPITPAQIEQVLGNEKVKAIAARLGLDPAVVSQRLAAMLPHAVDQMTPNGRLPGAPPAP